jgi:hypothetical protein
VLTLSSITAKVTSKERVIESMLPYLSKHGQHICSMRLARAPLARTRLAPSVNLQQLPVASMVQLTNLEFHGLGLQAGEGFQGVLGTAGLPLKQLWLSSCQLLDGFQRLGAALLLLPELQYLRVDDLYARDGSRFATDVLQRLPQLTYVEIVGTTVEQALTMLQPLQALTRLAELRLRFEVSLVADIGNSPLRVDTNTLTSSHHLTHLELPSKTTVEPGVLADKTRLQQLRLPCCRLPGGAAGVAQLMFELQQLQQLTHLHLAGGWRAVNPTSEGSPPAAAFSAMTASSKLQLLDISECILQTGTWQHVFPAGRQLAHLQSLDISRVMKPPGGYAAAPEGSRLARCCSGLKSLRMLGLTCGVGQLAALGGLTGLHTLHVTVEYSGSQWSDQRALDCACSHLTGLRELNLDSSDDPYADEAGLLLQLTQLRQLTALSFTAFNYEGSTMPECEYQDFEGSTMPECEYQDYMPCEVSLLVALGDAVLSQHKWHLKHLPV